MKDTWKEIRYCFYAMNKWYNDLTFYHYIGFLIHCNNKKNNILNLYNLYIKCCTKEKFEEKLKDRIKEIIIEYKINYKIYEIIDKKDWLNIVMEDYKDNIDDNIESDIKKYLDDDSKENFEELYNTIVKHLFNKKDDDEIDEIDRDNLYNLTLLDSHTNRSYGNAFFKSKRKRIIKEDKNGNFIPICTKNVFLKYFNTDASTIYKYTKDDAEAYATDIYETLNEFLPKPNKESEQ